VRPSAQRNDGHADVGGRSRAQDDIFSYDPDLEVGVSAPPVSLSHEAFTRAASETEAIFLGMPRDAGSQASAATLGAESAAATQVQDVLEHESMPSESQGDQVAASVSKRTRGRRAAVAAPDESTRAAGVAGAAGGSAVAADAAPALAPLAAAAVATAAAVPVAAAGAAASASGGTTDAAAAANSSGGGGGGGSKPIDDVGGSSDSDFRLSDYEDDEVNSMILSEREREYKQQLWLEQNKEWLELQEGACVLGARRARTA
jgi:hypothetical protein